MNNLKLIYTGTVDQGALKISNRKQFDSDIKVFEGKRVELVMMKAKKHRSLEQNNFYWGVVLPCALRGLEDVGNVGLSIDLVHSFFKDRFLPGTDIIIPKTAEVKKVVTTTTLSTSEMMTYTEQIRQFCAELLNVIIPEPTPIFNQ